MAFETHEDARRIAAAEMEAKKRLEVASEAVRELYSALGPLKGREIHLEIDGTSLGLGKNTKLEMRLHHERGHKTDPNRGQRALDINAETRLNLDTVKQILNNPNAEGETWALHQKDFLFLQDVNREGQVDSPSMNEGHTSLFPVNEKGEAPSGAPVFTNLDEAPRINASNLPELLRLATEAAKADRRYSRDLSQ